MRFRLDRGWIQRLKEKYRAGVELEPITVAMINEQPYLISGWHRAAALEEVGAKEADARIVRGVSVKEARWQAAQSNQAHGLPLKRRELRNVFRAFVDADNHTEADEWGGTLFTSYRRIAREVGVDHKTVIRWMQEDYPKVAAEMMAEEQRPYDPGPPVRIGADERRVMDALSKVFEGAKRVRGKDAKARILQQFEAHCETLRQASDGVVKRRPIDLAGADDAF
jgi:hypothetical protein